MTTDRAIKDSIKNLEPITNEIDSILAECQPILQAKAKGISETLILAKGVFQLKNIFYENKEIKATIMAMKDSNLGFLTDRSPKAIAYQESKGKKLKPYTYSELADCCLEALLNGYRLTGNEFNVIAGNFYPAKNGKYRFIMENNSISEFSFSNSPPIFNSEERIEKGKKVNKPFAYIECYASWRRGEKLFYIGNHPLNKNTDPLSFKIKANDYMGDDGVIGKALSKLFTRVLLRLSFNCVEDSNDISSNSESVGGLDLEFKEKKELPLPKTVEEKDSNNCLSDIMLLVSGFNHNGITEDEICQYFNVKDILELDHKEGLLALASAVSDVESKTMEVSEFLSIAKERYEMMQKQEEGAN